MSDNYQLPAVPDFLADLLDEEIEEIFASEQSDRVRLPYITIPQFSVNVTDYSVLGKVVLKPVDKEAEPTVVDSVRLMLIDVLTATFRNPINGQVTPRHFPQHILNDDLYKGFVSLGKEGIGGRTMWPLKANGDRDMGVNEPVCRSDNGITPWKNSIGKQVLDPRRNEMITIGQMVVKDDLGEDVIINSKYPCLTCPLGRFMKGADGKNLPPPCNHTPVFVLYNLDDGQLYTLRAQNRGLLQALLGVPEPNLKKEKKDFAYWNDEVAMGIEFFFATAASNKYVAKTLEQALGQKPNPSASLSRPYGMPSRQNPTAPVYPVVMTITLSNYTNPTLVPQFHLPNNSYEFLSYGNQPTKLKTPGKPTLEERVRVKHTMTNAPLNAEEMAGWLAARKQYHDEHMREALMSMADVPAGISVSGVTPEMLAAGASAAPQLPASNSAPPPWTDGDVVEE